MPRITKRQKDAGKEVKPRPAASKPTPTSAFKSKTRSSNHVQTKPREGFRVGPAHAPKNAYLGKANKIKADLIERARMTKSYAKVLKQEGMESGRVKDRTKVVEEVQDGGGGKVVEESSKRTFAKPTGSEGGRGESSRPRPPSSSSSSNRYTTSANEAGPSTSSSTPTYKGKGKQRDPNPYSRSSLPSTNQTDEPLTPYPAKRQRALSPPMISHPMPLTELRQLKKEAYAKYHLPRSGRDGGTGGVSGGIRVGGRSVSAGTTRSVGSGSGFGGFGNGAGAGGSGKMRGQPNMGARMGVLLEKIKRDRAA